MTPRLLRITLIGADSILFTCNLQREREEMCADGAIHAAMRDPHTAAVHDLEQIRAVVDELLKAHAAHRPTTFARQWCRV